jgi:hypothetical protein
MIKEYKMFRNNNLNTRRETTDIWESKNIILDDMELGVEIILNEDRSPSYYNIKLGDGNTPWNSLNYFDKNLNEEDTNEILDDFTINLATRKPVANRIPIYGDEAGLKSDKVPTDDNDVLRKADIDNPDFIEKSTTPTPLYIAQYNEDSGLKSDKVPDENNDVIRKIDLNSHEDNTTAHSATTTPTASKIAMYNSDSGLKSGKIPTENNDVIRFLEFNDEIADINSKISTLNGAYYVLDAYDFGKTLDVTDPADVLILNTYAISNTPDASSMADVYNDTVIINEFDTSEFVYNKIAELWVKYPNGYLTIATNNHLGVVKGTEPPADPADESKDTYVQVLADGAMKLVGDRLGKVNTVDNVPPDINKNIELSLEMTKEEFDALEDPPGSGLHPSLKGKTVTLTNVYPKNARRIPYPDYDNMESSNRISTNNGTWEADRTGYVRVFGGATTQVNIRFYINNKNIGGGLVQGTFALLPIRKGQTIKISVESNFFSAECYFIPIVWVDVEDIL